MLLEGLETLGLLTQFNSNNRSTNTDGESRITKHLVVWYTDMRMRAVRLRYKIFDT